MLSNLSRGSFDDLPFSLQALLLKLDSILEAGIEIVLKDVQFLGQLLDAFLRSLDRCQSLLNVVCSTLGITSRDISAGFEESLRIIDYLLDVWVLGRKS